MNSTIASIASGLTFGLFASYLEHRRKSRQRQFEERRKADIRSLLDMHISFMRRPVYAEMHREASELLKKGQVNEALEIMPPWNGLLYGLLSQGHDETDKVLLDRFFGSQEDDKRI